MWAWLLALLSSLPPPRAVRGVGDASTPIIKTSSDATSSTQSSDMHHDTDTEAELGPTAAPSHDREAAGGDADALGESEEEDAHQSTWKGHCASRLGHMQRRRHPRTAW